MCVHGTHRRTQWWVIQQDSLNLVLSSILTKSSNFVEKWQTKEKDFVLPWVANWEKTNMWGNSPTVVGNASWSDLFAFPLCQCHFCLQWWGFYPLPGKGSGDWCWGGGHFHKGNLCCFQVDSGKGDRIHQGLHFLSCLQLRISLMTVQILGWHTLNPFVRIY